VRINRNRYPVPYEIKAIGDPKKLYEALVNSPMPVSFKCLTKNLKFGCEDIVIPKYGGDIDDLVSGLEWSSNEIFKKYINTIICIILGIMLSWQYKSIESNKRVSASQTKNLYDLRRTSGGKKNNENLRARNEELENSWRSISMRRETINRLKKV